METKAFSFTHRTKVFADGTGGSKPGQSHEKLFTNKGLGGAVVNKGGKEVASQI